MKATFARMRLAPRLALAFALVLLVTTLAAAIGIWRLDQLRDIDDEAFAARINADCKLTSARSEVVRKTLEKLSDTDKSEDLFARIDAAGSAFRGVRVELVKQKAAGGTVATADIQFGCAPRPMRMHRRWKTWPLTSTTA